MKNKSSFGLIRISALVIVISILFTLLCSCAGVVRVFDLENLSKEEIIDNIDSLEEKRYQNVRDYIIDYGIRRFDVNKFRWAENVFNLSFNLEGGLPSTFDHAKMTITAFMENYYDDLNMDDEDAVTDALITCYVNAVGDEYSIYRTPVEEDDYSGDMSGKFGGIGVVIEYNHTDETLLVSSVYIDSPAEEAGILVGDFIVAVEGKTVEEIGYLNVVNLVRGDIGTKVNLTVKRGDALIDIVATRAEVEEKTVAFEILEGNIGYVQIASFKDNTYKQFVEAIDTLEAAKVKGYVFDLRNNLGGFVHSVVSIVSYLIPDGHPIISYQYKNSTSKVTNSTTDIHPITGAKADHKISVPVSVLCNEYTASAGELFTAAMRDYADDGIIDATIVGKKTYGKGIMQGQYIYDDGSSITLTVAYYNPPCGENYHIKGITPTPENTVDNEIVNNILVDKQLPLAIERLKAKINAN